MTNPEFKLEKQTVATVSRARRDAEWYAKRRLAALKIFNALPMPTVKDEAWRRTNLAGFKWDELDWPPYRNAAHKPAPTALTRLIAGHALGGQLVLAGGKVETLSLEPALKRQKVLFCDFLTATRQYPELVKKHLGRIVKPSEGKFAALAETLADSGLFVYVPKGVQVELPLHFVHWLTNPAHFSRGLIVLEDGASATVVQELASPKGTSQTLHAGTVEVLVGKHAQLTLVELQSLGSPVWNFVHERVRANADANVNWVFAVLGSRLTKNFAEVDLVGEGARAKMSGFYFADGNQHFDFDTQQNHLVPHTTSDLLFKGAVQDQSHSVWQGMIYVAPGAAKTDGYQANRNLVLSPTARADSLPGLEILNDDVRCTHGATVGQIEAEHVFYLMSRGLPRADAKQLVVSGFFEPVLDRIPLESVRQRLRKAIAQKMR